MGTISVRLTPELERFVDEQVRSGRYPSQEEAVRVILQDRKQREEEFDAWLANETAPAIASLDRGEHIDFTAEDVIARGEHRATNLP